MILSVVSSPVANAYAYWYGDFLVPGYVATDCYLMGDSSDRTCRIDNGGSTSKTYTVGVGLMKRPQITLVPAIPVAGQSVTVSWSNTTAINSCIFIVRAGSTFAAHNNEAQLPTGSLTAIATSGLQAVGLYCYPGSHTGPLTANSVWFTPIAP